MPPAAMNPFEKGFLDLPKLFIIAIKTLNKKFLEVRNFRNLFIKRFLVAEGNSRLSLNGTSLNMK
jgi:hypothetical protein